MLMTYTLGIGLVKRLLEQKRAGYPLPSSRSKNLKSLLSSSTVTGSVFSKRMYESAPYQCARFCFRDNALDCGLAGGRTVIGGERGSGGALCGLLSSHLRVRQAAWLRRAGCGGSRAGIFRKAIE